MLDSSMRAISWRTASVRGASAKNLSMSSPCLLDVARRDGHLALPRGVCQPQKFPCQRKQRTLIRESDTDCDPQLFPQALADRCQAFLASRPLVGCRASGCRSAMYRRCTAGAFPQDEIRFV